MTTANNQNQPYQDFEDFYETTDKVNVRFNLTIENSQENINMFSSSATQQKQSIQIQPFIQFKKSGLLKIYFKIVDFNNPSNTTIINSEIEMTSQSSSDSQISNSDCFLREVTTGPQSYLDEDHYLQQKANEDNHFNQNQLFALQKKNQGSNLNNIIKYQKINSNKIHVKATGKMLAKKVKRAEEKYLQKQKRKHESLMRGAQDDENNYICQRIGQNVNLKRISENAYKLRQTQETHEDMDTLNQKDDRLMQSNQYETSQSDILFNLYHGNTSSQHSPQIVPLNHAQRDSKNDIHSEFASHSSQLIDNNQAISLSQRFKSQTAFQTKIEQQENNFIDNSNNEYQDLSYSNKSQEQVNADGITVFTRTRRNYFSTPQLQGALLNELPLKKVHIKPANNDNNKDENGVCKGNAVNMAKNILKGFMEYVFVSAKEEDLIECCSINNQKNPQENQSAIQMESEPMDLQENEDVQNISKEQIPNNVDQQQEQDDENENCEADKIEEYAPINIEEVKDQKQIIDSIRKRFKKQYNSKMLEKPSNSKLLKLFSNNNYGKLFKHYFSSQEIMDYIESSNIQNKIAHKDLVEKIRSTSFDFEKLQDVLKTRIFKRPPFQKPQK
ncbi:hypothetical protein TTHERM_00149700 (macronuclear) [Tetrahymena thermophila SB210]|uniref:Uncharacterized protein n=1 Tax=Tetrahymena thermophila (strain SB210) TaxID=312017 RepID=I7M9D1_TETTS|nr:hypothetical protein TTHERM_00149700 [Tetrahymena thermophila SB210]EAS01359.2 hypothetical protein TTHERM_00149700 [Tetrahymena thermophila SB210]|eukprot:XP_001021605.2 hypothetical protein TTHERM_00149700 [Tetrahymena thermophila SB210]